MNETCDTIRELMSGYLDDELDDGDRERMEEHLGDCEGCREEFDEMTLLVSASSSLSVELPPEEVWDEFLTNVYNRTERQTGWITFIIGLSILVAWGLFEMVVLDWASPVVKFSTVIAVVGLVILFVSILRQRLAVRRADKYSSHIDR